MSSIAIGSDNNIYKSNSICVGANNNIEGYCCAAFGKNLEVVNGTETQLVAGRYNIANADAEFIVGVGHSDYERANGFVVTSDGRAKVYTKPQENEDVVRMQDIVYTSAEEIKSVIWG
jgi:hypothetical protein